MSITEGNYKAVTDALRAMLALEHPRMPGEQPADGPTGTPPTSAQRLAEFDQMEATSTAYRKLARQTAFDEFKGGTLAPVFAAEAEHNLTRLHLQELAFIYDTEFSNR